MGANRQISLIGLKARDSVVKGADYLADAIKATLGPFGTNALLESGNRPTNDGYTISSQLAGTLDNEFERRGAIALHEAASKTNQEVGDATTTVTALSQAILHEALKYLATDRSIVSKKKPAEIAEMIEKSRQDVISRLYRERKTVETEEELIKSALVAVEDDYLAELIGRTQWELGKEGYIITEEVIEPHSSIHKVKGIRIDNGMGAPIMITNQKDQSLELPDCSVILTNYTIFAKDIQMLKDKVFKPLIDQKRLMVAIIARAFDPEAIKLCMESAKAGFAIFPINAPYTNQGEIMRDLAAVTGSNYIDIEETALEDMNVDDVGFVTSIVARRWDAIITGVDTEKTKKSIEDRIKILEERINGGQISDFEKQQTRARIAQFKSGFAILKVGAETELERKYKKDKADDAVNSVRLALQEGTVKGAGLAFYEISEKLEDSNILKKPLQCIWNQIKGSAPEGFEVPEWCRDPYLTLVTALKNACSVATQLANIGCVITTKDLKPKEDEKAAD